VFPSSHRALLITAAWREMVLAHLGRTIAGSLQRDLARIVCRGYLAPDRAPGVYDAAHAADHAALLPYGSTSSSRSALTLSASRPCEEPRFVGPKDGRLTTESGEPVGSPHDLAGRRTHGAPSYVALS